MVTTIQEIKEKGKRKESVKESKKKKQRKEIAKMGLKREMGSIICKSFKERCATLIRNDSFLNTFDVVSLNPTPFIHVITLVNSFFILEVMHMYYFCLFIRKGRVLIMLFNAVLIFF